MDKIDEISTEKYRIWLEDNIVREVWSPNTTITLQDAQETVEAVGRLSQGRVLPLLVDTRNVTSIQREARECYAKNTVSCAVALVVKSALNKIIANFFLGLNRTMFFPTRVFNDEAEALNWLKGFLE